MRTSPDKGQSARVAGVGLTTRGTRRGQGIDKIQSNDTIFWTTPDAGTPERLGLVEHANAWVMKQESFSCIRSVVRAIRPLTNPIWHPAKHRTFPIRLLLAEERAKRDYGNESGKQSTVAHGVNKVRKSSCRSTVLVAILVSGFLQSASSSKGIRGSSCQR